VGFLNQQLLNKINNILVNNDLYIVPLHKIKQTGICSCRSFECSSKGKHPFFPKSWKQVASKDPNTVKRWLFEFHSSYNFGVLTGRLSTKTNKRLIIVDIDKITDENKSFIDKLPKETFSYKTGSGGFHYWYWIDIPVANSVSRLAKHVDIRGMNGYALIPPSNHVSGKYYGEEQLNDDYPILDFPKELLEESSRPQIGSILKKKITLDKSTSVWTYRSIPGIRKMLFNGIPIPKGVRNTVVHRLLSSDRAKGMNEVELSDKADYYKSRCEEYYSVTETELKSIVSSVMRYAPHRNLKGTNSIVVVLSDIERIWFERKISESINPHCFSTLKDIMNSHKQFMIEQHLADYPTYTTQQFSNILLEKGYKKKHTNRGNVWNLKIS
jgi:hypothetical protein